MAIIWGYTDEGIPISVRAPTKVAREIARFAELEAKRVLLKKLTEYVPPVAPGILIPKVAAIAEEIPYEIGTYKDHRFITAGDWQVSKDALNSHLLKYCDWIYKARGDSRTLEVANQVKRADDTETCVNLHTWFGQNIRYKLQNEDPLPFEKFWTKKEGDCTEHTNFSASAISAVPSWLKIVSYNYTELLHVYLYFRGEGGVWFPFDGTNYYPFGEPGGVKAVWLFQVDDTPDNPPVGAIYGVDAPIPPEAVELSPEVIIKRLRLLGKIALTVGIAGFGILLAHTLMKGK